MNSADQTQPQAESIQPVIPEEPVMETQAPGTQPESDSVGIGSQEVAGKITEAEARDLARILANSTGMKLKTTPMKALLTVVFWGYSILGGWCGLSIASFKGQLMPWSQDVQIVVFGTSIAAGIVIPLAVGAMLLSSCRRWVMGLRRREVILSLATVPEVGRITSRVIILAWLSTALTIFLPFFLLGLSTSIYVFIENFVNSWSRIADGFGMFFVVSSMAMFVVTPLSIGASRSLRIVIYLGAILPIVSPFWIFIIAAVISSGGAFARDLVYAILLISHMTAFFAMLIHFVAFNHDWTQRISNLAERA